MNEHGPNTYYNTIHIYIRQRATRLTSVLSISVCDLRVIVIVSRRGISRYTALRGRERPAQRVTTGTQVKGGPVLYTLPLCRL